MSRPRSLLVASLMSLGILAADPAMSFGAATITIVNLDGAGEGFNDPTPAAPVGGNPGNTIGQQRLNVFQAAASIWGSTLTSSVTIFVEGKFDTQTCTVNSAVLGSAGAKSVVRDFAGREVAATWYPVALGNKQAGVDLIPGTNDISATFNSKLGQPGCFTGGFFYYGLDHNEGNQIDLLAVVLHELGHGLGFQTFASTSTGALFNSFPDIYLRHLLDNSSGLHWDAMNDAQRQASAINWGNVVWDGTAVNVKSARTLGPRRRVRVTAPGGIAGDYVSGASSFGTPLHVNGTTAPVVLAVDGSAPTSDACSPLTNGAAVAGKICMIDRGTCTLTSKALAAQNAGAVGVIIVNNTGGPAPDLGGVDPSVTIPVASVSQTDGTTIRNQLGVGVVAALELDETHLQGADNSNHVLIYTPNPLQPGSSVSHWDVTATPNLLMEPIINPDLTNVDLTRDAFEDIGWFPHTTAVTPAPLSIRLGLSVPNPFTRSTTFSFTMSRPQSLSVDVLDTGGRLVRRLVSEPVASGDQQVTWDGADGSGRAMPPGVYVYRVRSGVETYERRVALVR
jgi:hypothetical protein